MLAKRTYIYNLFEKTSQFFCQKNQGGIKRGALLKKLDRMSKNIFQFADYL